MKFLPKQQSHFFDIATRLVMRAKSIKHLKIRIIEQHYKQNPQQHRKRRSFARDVELGEWAPPPVDKVSVVEGRWERWDNTEGSDAGLDWDSALDGFNFELVAYVVDGQKYANDSLDQLPWDGIDYDF